MTQNKHHDKPNGIDSLFYQLATICDRAVLVLSGAKVVFANDSAVGMLGAVRTDQVVGQSAKRLGLNFVDGAAETCVSPTFIDRKIARFDGSSVTASGSRLSCSFDGRQAELIVMCDTGERQRLEGRVQFLVRHDILTELPNRTDFRDRLVGAMSRAQRNARQVAVMLINVDHFKVINTRYGSKHADLLLQELARRLKGAVRLADAVARIAGDEFALILEAIDEREQAAVVANRVLTSVGLPFDLGGDCIEVTVSAGVAAFPSDAADLDTLIRMADVAMYAAKESGRGVFRLYFPEFEERSHRDQLRSEQTMMRMATLTEREREVMDVLVDGNSSKAIAYLLGASPRTIENHRAKVMAKMQADSLPDLVRMVLLVNQK